LRSRVSDSRQGKKAAGESPSGAGDSFQTKGGRDFSRPRKFTGFASSAQGPTSLEAETESNEWPAVVVSAVRRIRIAIVAVELVAAARVVATIVGPIVAMMAVVVAKRIVTMTPLAPM